MKRARKKSRVALLSIGDGGAHCGGRVIEREVRYPMCLLCTKKINGVYNL